MKRKVILVMLALLVAVSATAGANPRQHRRNDPPQRNERYERHDRHERQSRWDHPSYRGPKWRKVRHEPPPFAWHAHRDRFYRPGHRLEPIYDADWRHRFPGLRPYRWQDLRGSGFWYQGRYVRDAVMFYNDDDELVSIGFMHNGAFLFIRDDDNDFESRDSFFFSFWR